MLTLYEFNQLDDDQKAEATWTATFLGDRVEADFRIQLYGINNFYIEVFYDSTENKIVRFRAFKSYELLQPYLTHIKFNL